MLTGDRFDADGDRFDAFVVDVVMIVPQMAMVVVVVITPKSS